MTGKQLGKGGGASSQYWQCYEVKESELKVGDLGVYQRPTKSNNEAKHIGMYVGLINGKKAFIHSGGRSYGDTSHPTGRVVVSYLNNGVTNGGMYKGTPSVRFVVYVRPYVKFADDQK
jgi:cell wall-associated NlpC family hydrolase